MLVATMPKAQTYIARLLDGKDWTIDKLAREADLSYGTTHDIVTNGIKPGTRFGNIVKIAEALGVPLTDVVERHKRA